MPLIAKEKPPTTAVARSVATLTSGTAQLTSVFAPTSACDARAATRFKAAAPTQRPSVPSPPRLAASPLSSRERPGHLARTLTPSPLPSSTPIKVCRLHSLLAKHPDKSFTSYVLHGLDYGFAIGYTAQHFNLTSLNLPSALPHQDFISNHLQACCVNNETAGLFTDPPLTPVHCSGVGIVPKNSGNLCLIHHL